SFSLEIQSFFSLLLARRTLNQNLLSNQEHSCNMIVASVYKIPQRQYCQLSVESVIFIKKLRRLLKYMFFRDYKSKIVKGIDEDDLLEDKLSGSNNANKRQKIAQDFLNSIDQTGELLAMFEDDEIDEVKQERMELVDLALLVRQDLVTKAGDPFSHAISATFIQYHNSAEGSCMKPYPDSPENTPPPTPTAPSAGSQHSGKAASGSLGNGSAGQDSAKTKQRKRKKSTAACGVEAHSDAIQPSHIREAVRRYGHKIGPLSPFTPSLFSLVIVNHMHYQYDRKNVAEFLCL
ncbi:hypothetical protein FD754_003414, partial [Muntiacus muntjak]